MQENTAAGSSGWMKWAAWIAPPVIFLVIAVAYFSPVFQGKVLFQQDIFSYEGAAKEVIDFRKATGEEALWTNSMFGGMPAYQISTLYPGNLFTWIDAYLGLLLPAPVDLVFKLFMGFFFMMLVLRINPWLSGIASFAFAFSSYFFIAIEAGHNTKINTIAYMAPVVAGVILAYRGKYLLGAAITGFFLALNINANHYQISYYLVIILACLVIGTAIHMLMNKRVMDFVKASAALLIAAGIGIGPNVAQLWTTWEYSKETIRGKSELAEFAPKNDSTMAASGLDKDYAFRWSYGVGESMTLLVADAYGGSSQYKLDKGSATWQVLKNNFGAKTADSAVDAWPTYWGDQPFTSGPVFVGAVVCFLFILGLLVGENRYRWWLLAATLLSLLMSWGRNLPSFNYFLFDHLPMYNKFRAPAMILVIAEFTMPLLGFWALSRLLKLQSPGEKSEAQKKVLLAGGIVAGILALMVIAGSSFFSFSTGTEAATLARMLRFDMNDVKQAQVVNDLADALVSDRASIMRSDALTGLLMVLAVAGLLWAWLGNKIPQVAFLAVLGVVTVADLWRVDARYLGKDNFKKSKKEIAANFMGNEDEQRVNQMILQDKDPDYRVLNLTSNTFNDSKTSYLHKSVGGYHAAKLRRYQDLIENHLSGQLSMPVVNMMNTKYVIQQNPQTGKPQAFPNPAALGNAWFVDTVQWAANAREEIDALRNFDPSTTVVVNRKFEKEIQGASEAHDSTASLRLVKYAPNHLEYESSSSAEKIAVFSEIYYNSGKGWEAFVDGKPAGHIQCNYVLRGMKIPAGTHKIEFRFEPRSYFTGNKISLAASVILIAGFIGLVVMDIRRKVPASDDESSAG